MIDSIKNAYYSWIENVKKEIKEAEEKIFELNKLKVINIKIINDNSHLFTIKNEDNNVLFLDFNTFNSLDSVIFKKNDKINPAITFKLKKIFLKIIKFNRILLNIKYLLFKLNEKLKVDIALFMYILREHNKKMIKPILEKGYKYSIKGIGRFGVERVPIMYQSEKEIKYGFNPCRNIDWKKSLAYRNELIAEGKLLYKEVKDNNLMKVSDNGGIKWFIYYTDTHRYMFKWFKNYYLSNVRDYSFKILRTFYRKTFKPFIDKAKEEGKENILITLYS